MKRYLKINHTNFFVFEAPWGGFSSSTVSALKSFVLAVTLTALPARSQTLETNFETLQPGLDVTGTWDNGVNVNTYPAGQLQFSNLDAFCVEPGVNVGNEPLIYDIQAPGSLANYDIIARLVGGYLASSGTNEVAAGFQWAIYEVTSENLLPWNLLDGSVRITAPGSQSTAILANGYLANVNSYAPASITYLTNPTRQDIVAWNIIPEPSALGLAILSGALLLRRRRA